MTAGGAHPIPIEALDGKVGVLGITGSGKTFTAIGMVEQLLELGRQVIIVDPTGAYHGLRTVFPLPIFGGLAGDVSIGQEDGERIARVLVERNVSAIIDVSLLLKESHAAARRFMAGFVAALKNAPARARYMVMDEADEFMPENVGGGDAKLFGDLKWIVRRGRKDGWRMLMVTQRPQDIAKSVLTQCETLVIHKLTAPQDRRAIEEWVKGNADADQAKEVLGSLARLDTGEAWIWSPRHDLLVRARLPLNRSADTSRTPDADDEPIALAKLDAADLGEIREAMAATGTAAAAGEALRDRDERIAALEQQLAAAEERGVTRGIAVGLARARAALDALRIPDLARDPAGNAELTAKEPGTTDTTTRLRLGPTPEGRADTAEQAQGRQVATARRDTSGGSPAALAIAELLDRVNPARLTWAQAAAMTGRKASGGNFNAARKWLRESGRIAEEGDLIRSARAEPAGMSRTDALSLWRSVLSNPAPKMLDALDLGGPLSKEELGEAIGAQPRGGNFNSGLAQLRRNGVVVERAGRLVLADPLPGEAR